MSDDMFFSQPAPRSPATDFQADKTSSLDLKQSSKATISRNTVNSERHNFLATLAKAARERVLTKRQKYAPDEPSTQMEEAFDVRKKGQASPVQIAPGCEFMAAIKILENLGLYDAIGRFDLHRMKDGKQPVGRQTVPIKMLIARLQQNRHQAAIRLGKGQYEAIIDWNSGFLGHIRIHVSSEKQQVTVRILVEHDFVKSMIESNLNQLKADMQLQGLEVDKLEVMVSCRSEVPDHLKERPVQWTAGPGDADRQKIDNHRETLHNDNGQPPRTAKNPVIIDYFA